MNSPDQLAQKLARQWHNSALRAERLLSAESWPLSLSIGKPSAKEFTQQTQWVLQHVQAWRQVTSGKVEWEAVSYRSSNAPILMPLRWVLQGPSDWIQASADSEVRHEFRTLEEIIGQVDATFHPLLIKHRALWRQRQPREIIAAAMLASRLTPGCARGLPLRLLSGQGVDTKFIENNVVLLTRLLDERFAGEASKQGLTNFLNALDENNHWVLVAPLSPGLLPFRKCKVTTAELAEITLPARRLLVVENEQSLHQLPPFLPDTIAILGTGLDLQWLASPALAEKMIAYWGDMDSWGLLMLSWARKYHPTLNALMMNRELFDRHARQNAVPEPVKAQELLPATLLADEASFYHYLVNQHCGRLEQEFLPSEVVIAALDQWVSTTSDN